MKKVVAIGLIIGIFASCEKKKPIERPRDVWVFRSVLDQKPRMVTVALDPDIWVAYDAPNASLYKAWKGGVNFDGAVYTTVHGPQPTSKGYAYYTDPEENNEWTIRKGAEVLTPVVHYRGHQFIDGQVEFHYELAVDGQQILVKEIPEALHRDKQTGLSRKFTLENAGEYQVILSTSVSSLSQEEDLVVEGDFEKTATEKNDYPDGSLLTVSGNLVLKEGSATTLLAFFHEGFEEAQVVESPVVEEIHPGARLIERSDCKSCHNEKVQTVGPAYLAVARRYTDGDETMDLLTKKVIKGGSGVWGEAMMTPHASVPEEDVRQMVAYILSLDDQDGDTEVGAWHLGQKTVPVPFAQPFAIKIAQSGLAAYEYVYTGDQPNFEILKGQSPINGALVPQVHALSDKDFSTDQQQFAVVFKGMLTIPKAGSYSFRLASDDGSWLSIDGQEMIDFGGFHAISTRDGEMYLKEGKHPLEIRYFQGGGGAAVSFQWFNKEKGAFEVVPQSVLSVSPDDFVETKPYVPESQLVKSIPGDRQWLAGVHPAFDLFQARPEDFHPRVGGIDFLSEDEMVVCTWDSLGPVYQVSNFRATNPADIQVKRIASGLAEPLGIRVVDGEIYVLQKQELTKLIDHDGDGIMDEYRTVSDDWKVSANFHEFAFGLVYKEGFFYGALATAILPGGASAQPQIPDRGKVIKISKETGEVEFISSGLRTPNGIGIGVDGEIFVCDNQGDWLPASKINHVRPGAWFGSHSVDPEGTAGMVQDEPMVWLTQDEIGNSPSTPLYLDKEPYAGQMIHCDVTHGGVKRVFVEKINGNYQGVVFRFSQGIEAGINRMAWAPDGSLLLGGIGVSGNWGQTGKLGYGLQRLVFNEASAFEILSVSARSNGFELTFTEPIKDGQNVSAEDFQIEQYYFEPTPDYGGPKLGLETLSPKHFYLSEDRKKVFVELDGLKEKHVVYFRIQHPFMSEMDHELWTTEAWYTLTAIPKDLPGFTNDYQVQQNTLTQAEQAAGWKLLFDGKTTNGLHSFNSDKLGSKWKVLDGTLALTAQGTGGDAVITDQPYENYELVFDWKIAKNGNSGVIFNVVEDPKYGYPWLTGPEFQLLDNPGHPDGQILKHRSGDLYDMIQSKFVTVNPTGEWNRARLKIKNGHVEHWLNGYLVVSYDMWTPEWEALVAGSKFADMPDFGKSRKGHVVLQDHGDQVAFRNIKIKVL